VAGWFQDHNGSEFYAQAGSSLERCRARLERLRQSVRNAGLPDLLIGAGIMSRSKVSPESPVAKLFDFTATYMSIPPVEIRDTEYPFLCSTMKRNKPAPGMPTILSPGCPTWLPVGTRVPGHICRPIPIIAASSLSPQLRNGQRHCVLCGMIFKSILCWVASVRWGATESVYHLCWNEFGEGGFIAPTTGEGYMNSTALKKCSEDKLQGQSAVRSPRRCCSKRSILIRPWWKAITTGLFLKHSGREAELRL